MSKVTFGKRMAEGGVVKPDHIRRAEAYKPGPDTNILVTSSGGKWTTLGRTYNNESDALDAADAEMHKRYTRFESHGDVVVKRMISGRELAEGGIVEPGKFSTMEEMESEGGIVDNPGYILWFQNADGWQVWNSTPESREFVEMKARHILDSGVPIEILPYGESPATYMGKGGILPKFGEGGVVAVIGEAGPEAVIPLDDPDAVEVMADAIAEGDAGGTTDAEAAVEIATVEAEAAVEIATVEAEAAVAIVEAETEAVSDVADTQADTAEAALDTQEAIVEEVPTTAVAEEAVEAAAEVVPDEAPGHTGVARRWWGD